MALKKVKMASAPATKPGALIQEVVDAVQAPMKELAKQA
jgi:hypothetical protein